MDLSNVEMHNGVSAADWLGTAGLHCKSSATLIELMRTGKVDPEDGIRDVEDGLLQALYELREVKLALEES